MKWMLAVVLSLAAVPSFAADREGRGEDHPCWQDAKKLCPGVKPGEGRILACLKQHEGDLSAACRERREEFHEDMERIHAACQADREKLCPNLKGKPLHQCMRQHRAQVSEGCKASWGELREDREGRGDRDEAREHEGKGDHDEAGGHEGKGDRDEGREHGWMEWREDCGADAKKLCAGVKPGGGRILECLKQHSADVSAACRGRIAGH